MTNNIWTVDEADFAAALLMVGAPIPYRYHPRSYLDGRSRQRRSGGLADDLETLYSPDSDLLTWMKYYSALATWLEVRYGKQVVSHSGFVAEWIEQYEKWFDSTESNLTQCVKGDKYGK